MALAVLNQRRTIRQFQKDAPIPKSDLEKIVEAARNAPTSLNIQDHDFLICTNKEKLNKIADVALASWPEEVRLKFLASKDQLKISNPVTGDAPCVIFLVKNERADPLVSQIDAGVAVMTIMVAAKDLGYDTRPLGCLLWGKPENVEELLGISKGTMTMALAIGKAVPGAYVEPKKLISKATYIE